jgi:hypothetical protein
MPTKSHFSLKRLLRGAFCCFLDIFSALLNLNKVRAAAATIEVQAQQHQRAVSSRLIFP